MNPVRRRRLLLVLLLVVAATIATALGRSAGSRSRSGTIDWRSGFSSAMQMPSTNVTASSTG